MNGFRTIEAPQGHFYADPFLVEDEGKTWLFFEDYIYKTGRGNISCAEVTNGEIGNAVLVLERPYHLSYPCVFRDGGEWFMIPETAANGTVELYRCLKFPHRWELHKKLFGASAVDTTLWVEDGVYWFFTSLREPRGRATQLWLFHTASLTGDWTAHPSNPISTDVRNSRGAGAIFRHNGKLFRPSQDCSRHYGYSFTLNEILTLTLGDYAEKAVVTVNPLWAEGLAATHSYSRAGEVEIIDGCWPVPEGSV